jgi:hypothetical protein
LGTLGHRLWVITLTFAVMAVALFAGLFLGPIKPLFIPLLLISIYWMALMSGEGAELERGLLFAIFMMLAGAYTPSLTPHADLVAGYSLMGYLFVICMMLIIVFIRRHDPSPFTRLRATIRHSLQQNRHRHLYAVIFCATIFISILIVDHLNIHHGYWAVGTVLIILRPDTKTSIYRGIQRFFGTLVGVVIAEILIFTVHEPLLAIALIGLVAFIAPLALLRSYWWGSGMVAVMLLLLLDLPSIERGDFHTPLIRLQATAIGCLLALIGIVLMNPRILREPLK